MASDAIRCVENPVLMAFDGTVLEGLVLRAYNSPKYTTHEFKNAIKLLGIKLEYIQKHIPDDNAETESFHNSIKADYIWPDEFRDFNDDSIAIRKAFADYNECRPHSSTDYPR